MGLGLCVKVRVEVRVKVRVSVCTNLPSATGLSTTSPRAGKGSRHTTHPAPEA